MEIFNSKYFEYLVLIVVTFIIVSVLSYAIRKSLDLIIRRNSKQLHSDPTNFIFLKNSSAFVLYAIGIFWIFHKIPYFNSLGTALFAGAGVIAAVIGFASQKAFSNIIGGLFILIFKPFRVGDIIEISNSRKGIVEEITLRHTIIKDYQFQRIVIPNSQISEETIINSSITDDKIRKHVEVGVSYESDLDLAIQILRNAIMQHPLCIDNRTPEQRESQSPIVDVKVVGLGEYSVVLRAYVWANNYEDAFAIQCDVFKLIKSEFDHNGIEIPYPHRTIVYKSDILSQTQREHA